MPGPASMHAGLLSITISQVIFYMQVLILERVVKVKYSRKVRLSVSSIYIACIQVVVFLPFLNVSSLILSFPSITEHILQVNKVFVGNISPSATSMKLFSYFSRFGLLLDIHIPGRHRGSCFVKFRNGFDSLCLLNTVHIFEHYCLVVKEARTKECASN